MVPFGSQDMLQVSSQRMEEFDTQSLFNFLSALVVLREEDWFSHLTLNEVDAFRTFCVSHEAFVGLVWSICLLVSEVNGKEPLSSC